MTFDHFFCSECENRFGIIEAWYAEIIRSKNNNYPPAIPYLFWMSVAWRMSIARMGILLPPSHEEKYRSILDKALALNRKDVCIDIRKLGHCAYSIHRAKELKGEAVGILGMPAPTIPALFMIGDYAIRFHHSLDRARKDCKRYGMDPAVLNDGSKPEVVSESTFIKFWQLKRRILDESWKLDYENNDNRSFHISQFLQHIDLERELVEATGDLVKIHPASPDMEGHGLIVPRSIRKIMSFMEKHPESTIDDITANFGYTPQELNTMLSIYAISLENLTH